MSNTVPISHGNSFEQSEQIPKQNGLKSAKLIITKWPPKCKIDHNSLNFETRNSIFCMVVYIDPLLITHFERKWPQKRGAFECQLLVKKYKKIQKGKNNKNDVFPFLHLQYTKSTW